MKYNVKQHPTLNDKQNGVNLFQSFENSMTLAEFHNCADVTALFIEYFDYYGLSNANTDRTFDCRINQSIILTGLSISFFTLNVHAIIFSVGHELGHHFRAIQNPEVEEFPGEAHGNFIMVGPKKET